MSPRSIIMASSLAANVALGAVLWFLSPPSGSGEVPRPEEQTTAAVAAVDVRQEEIWDVLTDNEDDSAFISRLRAEGFPERVVRSLAKHRVESRFADVFRRRYAEAGQRPYWLDSPNSGLDLSSEARAELREIARQVTEQTRLLLGPAADTFLPGDYGYNDQHRYGNLSAAKVTALKFLNQDYSELINRVRQSARGILIAEDRENLLYLERERQADIARLLTPEELDQYERRSSSAASFARTQLQYLDASEDDFLTLYRLRRDFDEQYGRLHLSPAQAELRRAAQPELDAQIEAALGPERFAEYQIVNDGNYAATRTFVTQAGLPPGTANSLIALQREFSRGADAVRANASLSQDEMATSLERLRREAIEATAVHLGNDQTGAYQTYAAGRWLSQLASPTRNAQ